MRQVVGFGYFAHILSAGHVRRRAVYCLFRSGRKSISRFRSPRHTRRRFQGLRSVEWFWHGGVNCEELPRRARTCVGNHPKVVLFPSKPNTMFPALIRNSEYRFPQQVHNCQNIRIRQLSRRVQSMGTFSWREIISHPVRDETADSVWIERLVAGPTVYFCGYAGIIQPFPVLTEPVTNAALFSDVFRQGRVIGEASWTRIVLAIGVPAHRYGCFRFHGVKSFGSDGSGFGANSSGLRLGGPPFSSTRLASSAAWHSLQNPWLRRNPCFTGLCTGPKM